MKRTGKWLAAACAAVLICACGTAETPAEAAPVQPAEETEPAEKTETEEKTEVSEPEEQHAVSGYPEFDLEAGTVTLNSGYEMPVLGLGMFALSDSQAKNSTYWALKAGFRLIDTARIYGNEAAAGRGLKRAVEEGIVTREDVFITAKMWTDDYDRGDEAIDASLERLGVDYIDLMILHHSQPSNDVQAYQAMERAVKEGKLHSIGLSNYYEPEDFDRVVKETEILPALLQNETHPYHQSTQMKEHIAQYGTVLESWFPLGGRGNTQTLFNDETIKGIAEAHGKSSAQVIIRWHLQSGNICIPGSSNEQHIIEDHDVWDFELSDSMCLKKRIRRYMKNFFHNQPDGYRETIENGIHAVRYFSGKISRGDGMRDEQTARLKQELETADAVVIGAGAGLSTSSGFTYSGDRFRKYFFDFEEKYGFHDMYSGGFHMMHEAPEVLWAYWARNSYINRYMPAQKPVYEKLLEILKDKDYFVITTNVDHQFQRAGFDRKRLFYTQGDYGLFQSVNPAVQKTYDNEEWVMKAMEAQGFVKDENGIFQIPEDGSLKMRIPSELVPKCPDDGSDVMMNLRSDDSFVEDEGWHKASAAYADFLRRHEGMHVLYLELGVGANTPVIIKYPFWQMTMVNKNAVYACVNYGEAFCPQEIGERSICIDGDIGEVLNGL